MAVDDATVFQKWLQAPFTQRVWPLPDNVIELSSLAAGAVGVASPHVRLAKTHAVLVGSFEQAAVEAMRLPSGYIAVSVVWLHAQYQVQWANPIWEALECDATAELEQINARLARTFADLPNMLPAEKPLSDAALGTGDLPVIVSARLKQWGRAFRLWGRGSVSTVWVPPWD